MREDWAYTHSREEQKMGFNICSIQEKRLVDRLSALKVIGEVIEKKTVESSGDQPEELKSGVKAWIVN